MCFCEHTRKVDVYIVRKYVFFIVLCTCLFTVNDGRTTAVPQYRGLTSAFATIFRQEGVKGLYKGVTPNVWGSGSAWGLYFML